MNTVQTPLVPSAYRGPLFTGDAPDFSVTGEWAAAAQTLWEQAGRELERPLRAGTVGVDPVSPREYFETMQLGRDDVAPAAMDWMMGRALAQASPEGALGNEEASALLAWPLTTPAFRTATVALHDRMARQLLDRIYAVDLLRDSPAAEGAACWRDCADALAPSASSAAPYSVNAVFVVEALRRLAGEHSRAPQLAQDAWTALGRWEIQRRWFHCGDRDVPYAALALLGGDRRPVAVPHLDQAYLPFYGVAPEREMLALAAQCVRPDYLCSPHGPCLAALDGGGTAPSPGRIIWMKQTAIAVAALSRGRGWCSPPAVRKLLLAVKAMAEGALRACRVLDTIPDLYLDAGGTAAPCQDPSGGMVPSNAVRLWSAIGLRRIIREWIDFHEYVIRNVREKDPVEGWQIVPPAGWERQPPADLPGFVTPPGHCDLKRTPRKYPNK